MLLAFNVNSQTGASRFYAAFYLPLYQERRGNRGLPELILLLNTQSFVEQHTAGPAVGGPGISAQYL